MKIIVQMAHLSDMLYNAEATAASFSDLAADKIHFLVISTMS